MFHINLGEQSPNKKVESFILKHRYLRVHLASRHTHSESSSRNLWSLHDSISQGSVLGEFAGFILHSDMQVKNLSTSSRLQLPLSGHPHQLSQATHQFLDHSGILLTCSLFQLHILQRLPHTKDNKYSACPFSLLIIAQPFYFLILCIPDFDSLQYFVSCLETILSFHCTCAGPCENSSESQKLNFLIFCFIQCFGGTSRPFWKIRIPQPVSISPTNHFSSPC